MTTINFFTGNFGGHEEYIVSYEMPFMPKKGELVYLPTTSPDDVYDGEIYIVKQVLLDPIHNEYNVYVKIYNWED